MKSLTKMRNRVCDLTTGNVVNRCILMSMKHQKVCFEDSCMIYVPYKVRYGENKADCINKESRVVDDFVLTHEGAMFRGFV